MESPNRWFIGAVCVCLVGAIAGFAYFGSLESQSCLSSGCSISDMISLVSSRVNSATSITLELSHSGLHDLSLASYYIRDSTGNVYGAPGWTSPTLPANAIMNITLTIDGKSFSFQSGHSYQVTMRTSQGYLDLFTITT